MLFCFPEPLAVVEKTRVLRTSPSISKCVCLPLFCVSTPASRSFAGFLWSRRWVTCKVVGDVLCLVSLTFLPWSLDLGLPCLACCSGFFAPSLCWIVFFVCDKWLLYGLCCSFRFRALLSFVFLETPTEGPFPLSYCFFLPLSLSVLVFRSSLLSAFASSASLVVLPVLCVVALACFVLFSFLCVCVPLLSAPSRWVVRGGSCLFFSVLLKRVCGRPRAGCLVCMRLSSLVCRPCLLFLWIWCTGVCDAARAHVRTWLCGCATRVGIRVKLIFVLRCALAYE